MLNAYIEVSEMTSIRVAKIELFQLHLSIHSLLRCPVKVTTIQRSMSCNPITMYKFRYTPSYRILRTPRCLHFSLSL